MTKTISIKQYDCQHCKASTGTIEFYIKRSFDKIDQAAFELTNIEKNDRAYIYNDHFLLAHHLYNSPNLIIPLYSHHGDSTIIKDFSEKMIFFAKQKGFKIKKGLIVYWAQRSNMLIGGAFIDNLNIK